MVDPEAINRVLALHHPRTMTLNVDSDCTLDSCDHDGIGPCPTYEALVCDHCQTLGDSQSEWETFLNEKAMWPCPTTRAIFQAVGQIAVNETDPHEGRDWS